MTRPPLHMDAPEYFAPPPLIAPDALRSWIVVDTEDLLVVDKPGWVVCHPSKNGPWSSLVGALREHTGLATLHIVTRLDRETSGIVLLTKTADAARRRQIAMQRRAVDKEYWAILHGELPHPAHVTAPFFPDPASPVAVRVIAADAPGGKAAETLFEPVATGGGFTLVRVRPTTGRKHQIRSHAEYIGHRVAGDKLYGGNPIHYLEFASQGWTPHLAANLAHWRQALHAGRLRFHDPALGDFRAPLAPDLVTFCTARMGLSRDRLAELGAV